MGETSYTLRVKLGDAEFSAEGPEDTVKEAYHKFLEALPKADLTDRLPSMASKRENQPENREGCPREIAQGLIDRAFMAGEKGVVSLRHLPPTEGRQQRADATILLLYGFQTVAHLEDVPVRKLTEGLRQSGIQLERLDRFLTLHSALYRKGGTRSGGRYTLNNQGVRWAEERLIEWYT